MQHVHRHICLGWPDDANSTRGMVNYYTENTRGDSTARIFRKVLRRPWACDQLKGTALTWWDWYSEFVTTWDQFAARPNNKFARKVVLITLRTEFYTQKHTLRIQHLRATRIYELVERVSKAELDYQEQEKADASAHLLPPPPPQCKRKSVSNPPEAKRRDTCQMLKCWYCPERHLHWNDCLTEKAHMAAAREKATKNQNSADLVAPLQQRRGDRP
ncbi:hypothetical protein PR048_021462 [Dryococelus australis]|uniref:Retrotransposon gag domain-containing protein n=1 Tax=Dryococelus australis TaxID=614101 RepID=A0ABQ9GYB3_9NEOP|nr:hypothetical protein PR048_021462 [Dryococelus australis]